MTGPEHYQHAEQLLDWAGDCVLGSESERYNVAAAQAHATLALAAAVAGNPSQLPVTRAMYADWREAIGNHLDYLPGQEP